MFVHVLYTPSWYSVLFDIFIKRNHRTQSFCFMGCNSYALWNWSTSSRLTRHNLAFGPTSATFFTEESWRIRFFDISMEWFLMLLQHFYLSFITSRLMQALISSRNHYLRYIFANELSLGSIIRSWPHFKVKVFVEKNTMSLNVAAYICIAWFLLFSS